jgi:DNA-binding IclR family transcriptional regulator
MAAVMKTPSVPALERGLRILECIAASKTGLTFSQIAKGMTIPKSSIHSLLVTFEREGYLHRSELTGRYICGMKLVHIANSAIEGVALLEQAGNLLRALANRTGLTVHMGMWERNEVALVAKVDPFSHHKVATWVGKRIDFHCTSLGKCLVAYLPEAELDRLVRECGLLRHNENTIASGAKLRQELAKVRKSGYAVDDEEEEIGIRCIGAPVFSADGVILAAISISGNLDQIDQGNYLALSSRLKETAAGLSAQFGHGKNQQLKKFSA